MKVELFWTPYAQCVSDERPSFLFCKEKCWCEGCSFNEGVCECKKQVEVLVGEHNHESSYFLTEEEIPGLRKTFTASEVIVHPKFNASELAYDVAILKVG